MLKRVQVPGENQVWRLNAWGGVSNFELVKGRGEVELVPGEVLVSVAGIGLNPVDWVSRTGGGFASVFGDPPVVLGWDISGTVVETALDDPGFALGDQVFGLIGFPHLAQGYSTYVVAKASELAHAPTSLPLGEAAGIPLAALTAWQSIFDFDRLPKGDSTVLIHAGGGAVGRWAIQFAKSQGATVYTTASADTHEDLASLGAIPIDYRSTDVRDVISGLDYVLDTLGGQTFQESLDLLRPGGTIITLLELSAVPEARARGFRAGWVLVHPDASTLRHIAAKVDDNTWSVKIDSRYSFDELPAAHQRGDAGRLRGKLVVLNR